MKKRNKILFGIFGVFALYYLVIFFSIIPWDMGAIQETMRQRIIIGQETRNSFDLTLLERVYVNEPGSCMVSENQLKVVRFVRQDPNLQPDQIGLLDIGKANVVVWRQTTEIVEGIEANMIAENRTEMSPEELGALSSLAEESGGPFPTPSISAYPPPVHKVEKPSYTIEQNPPLPAMWIIPTGFNRVNVFVRVVFTEIPSFTMRYTLLQKDNQWLISCVCRIYVHDGVCAP